MNLTQSETLQADNDCKVNNAELINYCAIGLAEGLMRSKFY